MKLTPTQVRDILMSTARDVTTGTNHPNFGNAATVGPDLATGNGLVDAHKAVLLAKVRCLKFPLLPFLPSIPLQPLHPALPTLPFSLRSRCNRSTRRCRAATAAVRARDRVWPLTPALPLQPFAPALPLQPFAPLRPIAPFGPDPGPFGRPSLSDEDLESLERLIIDEGDLPGS